MPSPNALIGVALFATISSLGCSDGRGASTAGGNAAPIAMDSNTVTPLGTSIDARAAKEILAHVPSAPPAATGPDVGSDTGRDIPDGGTTTLHEAGKTEHVAARVSSMTHVVRAKGSIERLLRATVYFTLVDRCRSDDGSILPPSSVKLHFVISEDGSISPTSVEATPKDPRFKTAAQCMVRELVASPFHAPADTGGETTTVDTDVPSVD